MIKKEISLVIGSIYEDLKYLKELIKKLNNNLTFLSEIVCVISGVDSFQKSININKLKDILDIDINIISYEKIIMPGESRNIGIRKSKYEYICFLDTYPLPDEDWIFNSITILEAKNLKGVLGQVEYKPTNEFEDCFISSTYGYRPIYCVPGTVIKKNLLNEIGYFVPNRRSGEDIEWINRSKLIYPNLFQDGVLPCKYSGLKGKNFIDLCKKWYSYKVSETINPIFYSQRILYYSFLIICTLLLALSWNDKIANWDQNSFLYVPHISKFMVSFFALIYFIYRMIILPIKKKVKIFDFNLIKFIKLVYISIILDLIKLIAFINHKK